MSMNKKAQRIVGAVLEDLKSRKGFDWWWDGIDNETKEEIESELHTVVMAELETQI